MKWSSAQTYECMWIAHVSITAYLHLQCKKVNMKDRAKKNKNQKLSLKQKTLECKKKTDNLAIIINCMYLTV